MELSFLDADPSPVQKRTATKDPSGSFVQHVVAKEFLPGTEWQKALALTATGDNVVIAANATKQNKISALQVSSSGTGAVNLSIKDGSTVIWQCQVPIGSPVQSVLFNPPLIGTVNTAVNAALSGAPTGTVWVNIQGYAE